MAVMDRGFVLRWGGLALAGCAVTSAGLTALGAPSTAIYATALSIVGVALFRLMSEATRESANTDAADLDAVRRYKALFDRVAADAPPSAVAQPQPPGGTATVREHQSALLVAAEATNLETAQNLFASPHLHLALVPDESGADAPTGPGRPAGPREHARRLPGRARR